MSKLFCEISPFTYKISVQKEILKRNCMNLLGGKSLARTKSNQVLPILVYSHNALIRRKLGNVDSRLQENKAVNLALAAPKVDKILIKPGETFSFWSLVGRCSASQGYKEGLTISKGEPSSGIGGGMCQFTNLIHWMILHSPLTITEHHHHGNLDLFPDYGRQIPFGTGTSIHYNYLDYRFINTTDNTFQLMIEVGEEKLKGQLRALKPLSSTYHIEERDAYFKEEADGIYRYNKIYRRQFDKTTGNLLKEELIIENRAKVMYDKSYVENRKEYIGL